MSCLLLGVVLFFFTYSDSVALLIGRKLLKFTVYNAMVSSWTAFFGFCHVALFEADWQDTREQSGAGVSSHLAAYALELAEEQWGWGNPLEQVLHSNLTSAFVQERSSCGFSLQNIQGSLRTRVRNFHIESSLIIVGRQAPFSVFGLFFSWVVDREKPGASEAYSV